MKLIHLSDLHLGKRVNEFSMLDDQEYILMKILHVIDEEMPDAVMIAGDIYDKSMPSAESVSLFDDFLFRLSLRNLKIFVISGNHDSPERIAFASRLLNQNGIYLSPVYAGIVPPISLEDEFGSVDFFLLPFIKPSMVRRFFPEETIETYTDAVRAAISHMPREDSHRSILITHQFFAGAQACESEDLSVGGTDVVDTSVLDGFDYIALGHLHGPQTVGKDTIRYCGTPLMYSFSEVSHQKSLTIVELFEKGDVRISLRELSPRHLLREIKGSYSQLTAKSFYDGTATDDYLHITLTDEDDILDAISKLRTIYPNIMKLDYDNQRTRSNAIITGADGVETKTPLELFSDFFEKQNNRPLLNEQKVFVASLVEKIWEDKK